MSARTNNRDWFKNAWRRILVDMHIPDWDPVFLSKLTPEKYVAMMELAGTQEAMVYANSHVGLCYYPTKTGLMHRGLKCKDFFGKTVNLCHQRGIKVVAYYSLIYNNWAYINHPEWRIIPDDKFNFALPDGSRSGRYGVCCPNSPYRDFALAQIGEFCSRYRCEGVFFDMTFWPTVCYCPHCINRYRKETGAEPPRVIDWRNPEWMRFQRHREKWMEEFAAVTTARVRSVRPGMTVTHQFSTILSDWRQGVPFTLANCSDYLSGDFYGNAIQQSVVCKLYHSLSPKKPFEFHTSRCLNLLDHVSMKSLSQLQTQSLLATAHGSAFMFIDAVNPDGTLNPAVYRQIRSVFEQTASYEPYLGGELCADAAVYYSAESKFDPADNGLSVSAKLSGKAPHHEAVMGACLALQRRHIPFTVITRQNLVELARYQVLILPDVLVMDEEEISAIRNFVRSGGSLYASYRTATGCKNGSVPRDFLLANVFGASFKTEKTPGLTFFTPKDKKLKEWFYPQDHIIHRQSQLLIKAETADVLAVITLPSTDPGAQDIFGRSFASIHSDPPGPAGRQPAIILNRFGKGKACYAAGNFEMTDHSANQRVFANLIRLLMKRDAWFEVKTHENIEAVLLHQPNLKRLILGLLAVNPALAGTRVPAEVRLRLPQKTSRVKVTRLPEGRNIPCETDSYSVKFKLEQDDIFSMISAEYT